MTIIIYHGKHEDEYYDGSSWELRIAAYRTIFNRLAEDGFYDEGRVPTEQEELFSKVIDGDDAALIEFMQQRSLDYGADYEGIEEVEPLRMR